MSGPGHGDSSAEAIVVDLYLSKFYRFSVRATFASRQWNSTFDRHVAQALPAAAQAPAHDWSQVQTLDVLRRVFEQGTDRTSKWLPTCPPHRLLVSLRRARVHLHPYCFSDRRA